MKSSAENEELRIFEVLECRMFKTIVENREREFTRNLEGLADLKNPMY